MKLSKPSLDILKKVGKSFKAAVKEQSPAIWTGIGIAGGIIAGITTVEATPKALKLIDEKKKEENKERLTARETVKATWKCYILPVGIGVSSIACILRAGSINQKRKAALATAYALSEATFKEYRDKTIETVGSKKEEAINDAVAKERLEARPVASAEVIPTQKGNTLCMDTFGRYFYSDSEIIRKAVYTINQNMATERSASLNDFYSLLNLSGSPIGDELGWNVIDGPMEIRFSSQLCEDGTPCLVLMYDIAPKYEYWNY